MIPPPPAASSHPPVGSSAFATPGATVLSAAPLATVASGPLPAEGCADCMRRPLVHARIRVNATDVHVFSVQLEQYSAAARLAQANHVRRLVDAACPPQLLGAPLPGRRPCAVVVAGDLGATCPPPVRA